MIRMRPHQRGTFNLWRLAQIALSTTRQQGQIDLFGNTTDLQTEFEKLLSANPDKEHKTVSKRETEKDTK